MVEELQNLGLTELEAKCYESLISIGSQTGYEIAKNIGSSRSNVYASLKSLSDKGAILVSEGQSRSYTAIDPDDLIMILTNKFKQSISSFKKAATVKRKKDYRFYNCDGLEAVRNLVQSNISKAKSTIIADVSSIEADYFIPYLEDAYKNGIKVSLVIDADIDTTIKETIVDAEIRNSDDTHTSFSLLIDNEIAIIGSFEKTFVPQAVQSEHPSLVDQLQSAFHHDLIMSEIKKDYPDEMETRYGKSFEKLIKD